MTHSNTALSLNSYGFDADNESPCCGFQMTVYSGGSGALELQSCTLSSMAYNAGANSGFTAVNCPEQDVPASESAADDGSAVSPDDTVPACADSADDAVAQADDSCRDGADSAQSCAGSSQGCAGKASHDSDCVITEDELDELIEFWESRGAPARRLGNVVLEIEQAADGRGRRRGGKRRGFGTRKFHVGRRNKDFMENERIMEKQVAAGAVHYDLKRILEAAGMTGA